MYRRISLEVEKEPVGPGGPGGPAGPGGPEVTEMEPGKKNKIVNLQKEI